MSERWLASKLNSIKDIPNSRFAYQSTINWMRSLAIVSSQINEATLSKQYQGVQRRSPNESMDIQALEGLMMAMHNCAGLVSMKNLDDSTFIIRAAITSWYYSIYDAAKAMVMAQSGGLPNTHNECSKMWQSDIIKSGNAMSPFDMSVNTIVQGEVEAEVERIKNGHRHDLVNVPFTHDDAISACAAYLNGTARYKQDELKDSIFASREFRELNLNEPSFRSKKAREVRDNWYKRRHVNFLTQAFRYRGKANYRDALYLNYGIDRDNTMPQFLDDLIIVSKQFISMSAYFISKRIQSGYWDTYLQDMTSNAKFDISYVRDLF